MTCIYPGCIKEGCGETSRWNVGELCDDHYKKVRESYGNVDPEVLVDFVKVHVLLQFNTEKCLKCIKQLEEEMKVAKGIAYLDDDPRFSKGPQETSKYLKLSRALEYYEGYCWFPANRLMFTGILSSQEFLEYGKYGFYKDPGAGPLHGDQSHRLQWHVIMRCMTNHFKTPIYTEAGWNHSPLGLFYEYTQGPWPKVDGVSPWARSMDMRANDGWGNPDKVASYIIKSDIPMISEALRRRLQKMGGLNIAKIQEAGPEVLTLKGKDFAERFEKQRGQFHEDLRIPLGQGMDFYRNKKLGEPYGGRKVVARFTRPNNTKYVLVPNSAPDTLQEINQDRVNLSKTRFNSQYLHSPSGAEPSTAHPQRW